MMAPYANPSRSGEIASQVSTDDLTLWIGSEVDMQIEGGLGHITYTVLNTDPDNSVNVNIITWTRADKQDTTTVANNILNGGSVAAYELTVPLAKNVAVQIQSTASGMAGAVLGAFYAY